MRTRYVGVLFFVNFIFSNTARLIHLVNTAGLTRTLILHEFTVSTFAFFTFLLSLLRAISSEKIVKCVCVCVCCCCLVVRAKLFYKTKFIAENILSDFKMTHIFYSFHFCFLFDLIWKQSFLQRFTQCIAVDCLCDFDSAELDWTSRRSASFSRRGSCPPSDLVRSAQSSSLLQSCVWVCYDSVSNLQVPLMYIAWLTRSYTHFDSKVLTQGRLSSYN